MRAAVTVEQVTGGKALARFVELPHALTGGDPHFAPMVMAWERYRLDTRRNPFFEHGDGAFFLARRAGRPVGRVVAHVSGPGGEGGFGFWWLDDDADAAAALHGAAKGWLTEQGCTSMTGPWSLTPDQEAGLQVAGHEVPGLTGRPWHPPHLARRLEEQGYRPVEDRPTWRLPAVSRGDELPPSGGELPGQAGPYADPRVVLPGIAAVPDLADALRSSGLRAAWALAKRAKAARWETCTVVRCEGSPASRVPLLLAAAARAGYRSVVAPWSPDPQAPPEAVHRVYRQTW